MTVADADGELRLFDGGCCCNGLRRRMNRSRDDVAGGQIRNGRLVSIQYRNWQNLRMWSSSRSGGKEVDLVVLDDGQVD